MKLEIHHYLHNDDDERIARIETLLERLMAVTQEVRDVLQRVDATTNTIAAGTANVAQRIDALAARVVGGISDADAQDIKAQLMQSADRLEAVSTTLTELGKDPANPIPPVPPVVVNP
jgi:hypothetical protein